MPYMPPSMPSPTSTASTAASSSPLNLSFSDEPDDWILDQKHHLEFDIDEPETEDSSSASTSTTLFSGAFSSRLGNGLLSPASGPQSTPISIPTPSSPSSPTPPPFLGNGGSSPPSDTTLKPLSSVPEDYGFDSELTAVLFNLPHPIRFAQAIDFLLSNVLSVSTYSSPTQPLILSLSKGEITAFFKDCVIAVKGPPEFYSKVRPAFSTMRP
jgi:hypothetical protein